MSDKPLMKLIVKSSNYEKGFTLYIDSVNGFTEKETQLFEKLDVTITSNNEVFSAWLSLQDFVLALDDHGYSVFFDEKLSLIIEKPLFHNIGVVTQPQPCLVFPSAITEKQASQLNEKGLPITCTTKDGKLAGFEPCAELNNRLLDIDAFKNGFTVYRLDIAVPVNLAQLVRSMKKLGLPITQITSTYALFKDKK